MLRKTIARPSILLLVGVVAGGIFTGAIVAGQFGGADDPEKLALAMTDESVTRVVDIPAANGLPARAMFVQTTSTGHLCFFDAPASRPLARQGGCNSLDDPLAGRYLAASLSYDGGPAPKPVSDARLIGLVSLEASSVEVLMSDGTRRDVPMRRSPAVSTAAGSFAAFGYRFKAADLKRGIGPTAVLALGSAGKEIDRQSTGWFDRD